MQDGGGGCPDDELVNDLHACNSTLDRILLTLFHLSPNHEIAYSRRLTLGCLATSYLARATLALIFRRVLALTYLTTALAASVPGSSTLSSCSLFVRF